MDTFNVLSQTELGLKMLNFEQNNWKIYNNILYIQDPL